MSLQGLRIILFLIILLSRAMSTVKCDKEDSVNPPVIFVYPIGGVKRPPR